MSQIETVNVAGIGKLKLGDYLHTRLRSAIRPSTTQSTELNFYQTIPGSAIPGDTTTNLTQYDTNLKQADGLPPGWAALVYYMSVWLPATCTLADAQDVNAKTLLQLVIGSTNKVLDDGHFQHFPPGSGLSLFSTASNQVLVNNAAPTGSARTPYALPHLISSDPKVPFRLTCTFTSALALGTRMTWYSALEGIIRQPVG